MNQDFWVEILGIVAGLFVLGLMTLRTWCRLKRQEIEEREANNNPRAYLEKHKMFGEPEITIVPGRENSNQRKSELNSYMCVVCGQVPVDVDAGYDTCPACARRI